MNAKVSDWIVLPLTLISIMMIMSNCSDEEMNTAIKDADGNMYTTVSIGNRIWLQENLKTTKFRDGSVIPLVTSGDDWAALTTPAYSWFNNDPAYKPDFGGLYNGYAVMDSRGLCPAGFHVSTEADWIDMELALGMPQNDANGLGDRGMGQNVGGKLKASAHWDAPNTGADNSSGFTAYGHGCRRYPGHFAYYHTEAGFYTATPDVASGEMWVRYLGNWHSGVYRHTRNMNYGYAIRCVKD